MEPSDDTSPESDAQAAPSTALKIATERDLRAHIRHICRRLDANPAVSRLLFINPILVLEDVGVEMSTEVREHIMNALRFPPKRRARMEALQAEIAQLQADAGHVASATTPPADDTNEGLQAAHAVCTVAPLVPENRKETTDTLATRHAELARLKQGAMVFFPRSAYEQFKRGEKKHRWIKAVRFGV